MQSVKIQKHQLYIAIIYSLKIADTKYKFMTLPIPALTS